MVDVNIVELIDVDGDSVTAVYEDSSDIIQLSGVDENGERQHFESEAYHSSQWAAEHGFQRKVHSVKVDIDRRAISEWNTTE